MTPTVLLFDIDGTLVTTGGAGRRAVAKTFELTYGRADACDAIAFGGMTDRAIFRLGLEALGLEHSPAAVDALLGEYLKILADEVARVEDAHYRVHAGMREAVQAGHEERYAVGLGTGNVEAGARIKLARVGLADAFAFGGFGDDAEDRAALILAGAQRGAQALGVPLTETRVLIIGDTVKDVAAALANGFECLGVATGGVSVEALRQAGAQWAAQDLAQPGALEFMLGR